MAFNAAFEATFAPFITSNVGSCLVGVIWRGILMVANTSDGKLVIGGNKGTRGFAWAKEITGDDDSQVYTINPIDKRF